MYFSKACLMIAETRDGFWQKAVERWVGRETLEGRKRRTEGRGHQQSSCISMMTSAVVFGSKLLSWGHMYGSASILAIMEERERIGFNGFLSILCCSCWIIIGLSDFFDFSDRRTEARSFRIIRRFEIEGLVVRWEKSSLLCVDWIDFELDPTLGPEVGTYSFVPSIFDL
jgi:hypothetical protein